MEISDSYIAGNCKGERLAIKRYRRRRLQATGGELPEWC